MVKLLMKNEAICGSHYMHISATCSYESILQDAKDVLLPKCNRHSNAKILSQKKIFNTQS